MNFKHIPKFVWIIFLDISAIATISYAIGPFATWYLSKSPAIGVDLYNSITLVTYQLNHFSLPFNSFRDIGFGGYPLINDYIQYSIYLMLPFAAVFGTGLGVQVFAIFCLFLLIFSCYLLFFKLSNNWGISIFLAIAVLLSVNIYGDLTWAGSLPYFLSQSFFPLGLFFGVRFFKDASIKNLSLCALITALGFLIHPLGIMAYLVPSLLVMIFARGIYGSYSFVRIFKEAAFFVIIFVFGSFIVTGRLFAKLGTFAQGALSGNIATHATQGNTDTGSSIAQVAQYYRDQIPRLWNDTSVLIFAAAALALGLFIISFIFNKQKKGAILPFAFVLITVGSGLLPILNLSGLTSIFIHDPYRAFWQFTIALAALSAALSGFFLSTVESWLSMSKLTRSIHLSVSLVISVVFAFLSYIVFVSPLNNATSLIDKSGNLSELSSAYPEVLSINLQDQERLNILKKQLLPSFMEANDKNRRFYTADQTVNLWWSSFFDIPPARGYADPPISNSQRGGIFWLDIAMTGDILTRDFKLDEQTALANTLFLVDWNGIYFFEGGSQGIKGPSPGPSSYLVKNNIFEKKEEVTTYGRVFKWDTKSGQSELRLETPENLIYYKFPDKLTSPIVSATNAPAAVVFSSRAGYEDILRLLASENINSRKLIVIWGGEYADSIPSGELRNFDAVFLYQYKYHNRAKTFANLDKYTKDGGKLFIDTGSEVKESNEKSLPDVFPFSSSERQSLGQQWKLSKRADEGVLGNVKISDFGPLVFDDSDWKLAVPEGKLRNGAVSIIEHRDRPVLVKMDLGKGKVIWSGINLPYHYSLYKKPDEAKLFVNIVKQFMDIADHEPLKAGAVWEKPERIVVTLKDKPRGILFKEQGYSGWLAKAGRENLPIYMAGPTYPGFMYVPLPKVKNYGEVTFSFNGDPVHWIQAFLNIFIVIFVLEFVIFDGRIHGRRTSAYAQKFIGKLFKWWEKEEG